VTVAAHSLTATVGVTAALVLTTVTLVTPQGGVGEVSASLGSIASTDWTDAKGFWAFEWQPGPEGSGPSTQGTTRRFDVGRVPHLNGDPTVVPSY
jgi:hypothetical protein